MFLDFFYENQIYCNIFFLKFFKKKKKKKERKKEK